MENNREKLLEVKDLSQYFKSNGSYTKAVDHVSFDVYKGEVFGIVGESGCGKTTTGRTIIKLYNATTGDVYFKGVRISAGLKDYYDEIKNIKVEYYKTSKLEKRLLKLKKQGAKEDVLDKEIALANLIEEKYKDSTLKNLILRLKAIKQKNQEIKQMLFDATSSKEEQELLEKEFLDKMVDLKNKRDEKIVAIHKKIAEAKFDNKNYEKKYQEQTKSKEKLMTKMQMIFQDPIASLDPRMTVSEIIAEGLKVIGITNKDEVQRRIKEVLEKVGLVSEHASRYPHEFSGGQRQRIGIARAIIMNPELIIADEPVSALDVSIQAQVINILNDLRHDMNLTIIFIAHDLSVVKYFSDRIAVMYYGKVVELASSKELFLHPLHPYTKSLLSAIPFPDPRYEKKRKRITYNPLASHDYSKESPKLVEIIPGHFVSCSQTEYQKYLKELSDWK